MARRMEQVAAASLAWLVARARPAGDRLRICRAVDTRAAYRFSTERDGLPGSRARRERRRLAELYAALFPQLQRAGVHAPSWVDRPAERGQRGAARALRPGEGRAPEEVGFNSARGSTLGTGERTL